VSLVNTRHLWKSSRVGRGRVALALVMALLFLGLAVYPGSAPAATKSQDYDALRLLTEALYEVNQKSVFQKSEDDMINGALRGLMNSLDPDSSFLTQPEYESFLSGKKAQAEAGVELTVMDNLLTVASSLDGGPASKAGVKMGDHILKINGQQVRNLTTQEASRRFQGAPGTAVKVQVLRNGLVKPLDLTITLEPMAPGTVTAQVLPDQFAYLRVRFFTDETPTELVSALKPLQTRQPPLKGLILDLRNNARGSLEQAVRTASVLLGDKEIVSTKGRNPDSTQKYDGKLKETALKTPLPMVVLVDQGTARAAEILAGALRDQYQATLLGAKTLGLCGLTKAFPLPDGSALVMTVAQCYTPSGQKIQGKGLEPKVAGPKPPEGPAGKEVKAPPPESDPWVLKALEVLQPAKASKTPKGLQSHHPQNRGLSPGADLMGTDHAS
jgi:carboxyl-terminal processing protease